MLPAAIGGSLYAYVNYVNRAVALARSPIYIGVPVAGSYFLSKLMSSDAMVKLMGKLGLTDPDLENALVIGALSGLGELLAATGGDFSRVLDALRADYMPVAMVGAVGFAAYYVGSMLLDASDDGAPSA